MPTNLLINPLSWLWGNLGYFTTQWMVGQEMADFNRALTENDFEKTMRSLQIIVTKHYFHNLKEVSQHLTLKLIKHPHFSEDKIIQLLDVFCHKISDFTLYLDGIGRGPIHHAVFSNKMKLADFILTQSSLMNLSGYGVLLSKYEDLVGGYQDEKLMGYLIHKNDIKRINKILKYEHFKKNYHIKTSRQSEKKIVNQSTKQEISFTHGQRVEEPRQGPVLNEDLLLEQRKNEGYVPTYGLKDRGWRFKNKEEPRSIYLFPNDPHIYAKIKT